MNFYYTDQNGDVAGPATREQLQEFVDTDLLLSTAQVCYEGSEDWQPISTYFRKVGKAPARAGQPIAKTAFQPRNVPHVRKPAVIVTSPSATPAPTSSIKLFAAVLFATLVAGGSLMLVWHFFLREKKIAPFTLSTNRDGDSVFESKGQVEGEIFVVTKGGQNYKLGLVTVALIQMDKLKPHLARKLAEKIAAFDKLKPKRDAAFAKMQQATQAERNAEDAYLKDINSRTARDAHNKAQIEAQAASKVWQALMDENATYGKGDHVFRDLPASVVTTQTNSDGKFAIDVPGKGEFAIAASSSRRVGETSEFYYWLIRIPMDGSAKKTIMLSNNNLTSVEDAPESLLRTYH